MNEKMLNAVKEVVVIYNATGNPKNVDLAIFKDLTPKQIETVFDMAVQIIKNKL